MIKLRYSKSYIITLSECKVSQSSYVTPLSFLWHCKLDRVRRYFMVQSSGECEKINHHYQYGLRASTTTVFEKFKNSKVFFLTGNLFRVAKVSIVNKVKTRYWKLLFRESVIYQNIIFFQVNKWKFYLLKYYFVFFPHPPFRVIMRVINTKLY